MTDRQRQRVSKQPPSADTRQIDVLTAAAAGRYGEILARSADMLTAHDESGRYTYVSPACETIYGRPPEELIGRHPLDFVHPDDRDRAEQEIARAIASEGTIDLEHRVVRPDETSAWVHAVIQLRQGDPGDEQHSRAVGSVRDITERKQAEAQYDTERRLLDTFLRSTPDQVYFKDRNGRFIRVSDAQVARLGFNAAEDVIGKTDFDAFSEQHAREANLDEHRILATGQPILDFEERETYPDGREAWVRTSKLPLRDAAGEIIGTFGISRDITAQRIAERRLLAAEQDARTVIELSGDMHSRMTPGGRCLWVSPTSVQLLGFDRDELLGKRLAGLSHPEDCERFAAGLVDVSSHGAAEVEYRALHKDGHYVWVHVLLRGRYGDEGELVEIIGATRDITAQRAAEDALNRTERELRTILELSGDMHVRTAADGRLLYVSPNSASVIGWSPGQLLGTRTLDYAHPDDVDRLCAADREVAETGTAEEEYRVRRPDGTYTWLHVLARGRHDDSGKLVEVVRAARNIDEQKRQETQLAEATRRFEHAFHGAPVGMALMGLDGRWLKVNPALCRITGYSESELLNKRTVDITHPEDRKAAIDLLERQRNGELDVYEAEARYIRADGPVIWIALSSSIVRDERGRALYTVSQTQDITAAKQAAAERDRLEAELQLAQKLEAVGQLAAGVAHEINTPIQFVGDSVRFLNEAVDELLTLITVYRDLTHSGEAVSRAQRQQRAAAAEEESEFEYLIERVPGAFERALDGIDRVTSIVQAMRQFAHPGAERGPTDINDGIRATLTVARNEYKYVADIDLDLGDLPLVTANAGDLNQVFLNLIVNAAHAIEARVGDSGDRGRIRISTRADSKSVLITISDSGCGIPPDIAGRVFDPFFTTKPVGRGTGQGLAIAYTIVTDRHHGTIGFTSAPGGGTTFEIALPLDEPAPPAARGCSEPQDHPPSNPPTGVIPSSRP